MFLPHWLGRLLRDRPARPERSRKPRGRAGRLFVEALEDRLVPALLGLAQEGLRPDVASGLRNNFSYLHENDGTNPFHYDSRALALTLGDGSRYTIRAPSGGGLNRTDLNLLLTNAGGFAAGVAGHDFQVVGKVVVGANTFDNTLLTAEVREFGFMGTPTNTEFEVRLVVTGGTLTQQPTGHLRVGQEMGLLIHQPGFPLAKFPNQNFSFSSFSGASDTKKIRKLFTNNAQREPVNEECGCAADSQNTGGNQVLLHDGSTVQRVEDLVIPGRGLNYVLERSYRSDTQCSGPLGNNWEMSYSRHLIEIDARNRPELLTSFPTAQVGDVIIADGYTRADLYVRNPDGSYTPPRGYYTQLIRNPDGSYDERMSDGMVTHYDKPATDGTAGMSSMADPDQNTLRFQYDSLGRLSRVDDTMGRPVDYAYNSTGQLAQVTDFSGRTVRYEYDANGNLSKVTTPAVTGTPNGNDFPNGKTTQYTYSSGFTTERRNHNLLSVIAPNEVANGSLTPRTTFVYDSLDRVVSVTEGGTNFNSVPSGGGITYQYQSLGSAPPNDFATAVNRTTVTDRNGNITEYEYNQLNNIVRYTERTNRDIRTGEPDYVTAYQYDGDYRLIREASPEGNQVDYTYDNTNSDRFQQGNRLTTTQTPDADRGGDQTFIQSRYTYEPIYNQVRTTVEPRGNDPSYVPQNGGPQSAARYATIYTYDYQEGTDFAGLAARIGGGITPAQVAARLAAAGVPMGLGDVNGDGLTNQIDGNVIRIESPTVTLLPGSNQAAVEGTTQQPIVTVYAYNDLGQVSRSVDPERNVTLYEYNSEQDPDGDGVNINPSGDPTTGGYLRQTTYDAVSDPARNSNTNPTPTNIRTRYEYDDVGNITRMIDGRGIATDYVYNQLNQVVQTTSAAAHGLYGPDPNEPLPLTDFQYTQRFFYDFNDNLILHQREDRGNTSNVDGNAPAAHLPAFVPGVTTSDPTGGTAYVDTVYQYDILDNRVEMVQEVTNGANSEFLRTRYRYDPNENAVLTIQPAGNAASATYDERDLIFQTTRGALAPPPLAHLAGSDPTDYDVRGGLFCQCTTYHYDGNRNVLETVDAADSDLSPANNSDRGGPGDRTRYVYDGFDRQTSRIDSVGNQTVYQYDPASNLVRETHFGPVGGPSPTSDGPDMLPGPVSQNGMVQSGNLVSANPLAATEYLYDELSRPIQTDQALFVNTLATTRPADVADGASDLGKGNLTPGDVQAIPGVVGLTILGRVSTRTEYDRNSRPTFRVEDDQDTRRYFYDGADRLIKTLDPQGNATETAYDDNGNVIETRETDVSQVPGVANELFLTTYFYDGLNRVQRQVDNLGQSTGYRYDSRDNLVATADAQGPSTGASIMRRAFSAATVNVNDFGNVTRYSYDGLDRLVRQEAVLTTLPGTSPSTASGDGVHIGASLFGVKDDPTAPESFPPAPDPSQSGDGLIRTGYTYDANSLPSALIDDQGNVTVYLYDNLNRRVTETKGLTVSTAPLDKNKILGPRDVMTPTVSTINNPAVIPAAQITAQLADVALRLSLIAGLFPPLADQVDDNPPTTIVWGYDPDDNVRILEDENDSETFTKYDALDRAVAVRVFRSGQADSHAGDALFAPMPSTDPSNPSSAFPPVVGTTKQDYQYDGLSRLVRATDNNKPGVAFMGDDSVLTYAYDSLSRVIEETQQIGNLPARAISPAWRAENLRSRLTYPNDRAVVYTYDALDRLNTVRDAGAAVDIADYDYIGVSRVLQRSFPSNGTRMTYLSGTADTDYDGLRRPVQLRHLDSTDTLLVGFTYTYDRINNKLTEGKLHDPENNEQYSYDSTSRLVRFERPNAGASTPLHGQWTLDGADNWEKVDAEMRQHSSFNEITQIGATPILSDDNGNETDDGTFQFTWDFNNQLRTVTRKSDGLQVAEYSYDALSRRVRKEVTNSGALDGTTDFYLDGAQEIEERDGADVLTQQYVYGVYADELLVLDRNLNGDGTATGPGDQSLFYHQNTLYSTFALTDDAGIIREGYQYDAYGRPTLFAPGVNGSVDFGGDDVVTPNGVSLLGNPYLFTGRRFDGETKLYYYRARYLNPEQGRFISRDPLGTWIDAFSLGNPYTYARNNPANFVDPLGLLDYEILCQGPSPGPKVIKLSFDDCTEKQQDDLAYRMCATFRAAGQAWLDAYRLEQGKGTAAARTTTQNNLNRWFGAGGAVTAKQVDKIEDVMWSVYKAFNKDRIGIECECKCDDNTNAYVYGMWTDIHICPAFWNNSNRKQSAILYHELTHEYGGTKDHGYVSGRGNPPTYSLKNTNVNLDTSKLINNADTYEEYVEQFYL